MANFTAGTSFTDGVTNDVTAAKLNALVADAVPTSNLSLNSTTGTIANFTASTASITLGTIPTLTAGTTTGTAGIFTSGTITTALIPTGTFGTTTSTAATITTGTIQTGTFGTTTSTAATITTGTIPTLTTGTTTSTNEVVTNGTITNLSATTSTFLGTITGSTNVVNIGSGQIYKDASGNVGIGTTTAIGKFTVEAAGGGASTTPITTNSITGAGTRFAAAFYYSGTKVGGIEVTASATSYVTSSDYRLKTNLEPISNGIERVKQLPVYSFNWIADEGGNKVDGFVAHEAKAIVPESVTGEKDAVDADGNPIYQGIDQSKIVPLLTAALKEAIAKIETLEAKVTALEAA